MSEQERTLGGTSQHQPAQYYSLTGLQQNMHGGAMFALPSQGMHLPMVGLPDAKNRRNTIPSASCNIDSMLSAESSVSRNTESANSRRQFGGSFASGGGQALLNHSAMGSIPGMQQLPHFTPVNMPSSMSNSGVSTLPVCHLVVPPGSMFPSRTQGHQSITGSTMMGPMSSYGGMQYPVSAVYPGYHPASFSNPQPPMVTRTASAPAAVRRRRSDTHNYGGANSGPKFSTTKHNMKLWKADRSAQVDLQINAKIDRGFFLSDQQEWTCYRRNYFQVSAAFQISHPDQGARNENATPDNDVSYILEVPTGKNSTPAFKTVKRFYLKLSARIAPIAEERFTEGESGGLPNTVKFMGQNIFVSPLEEHRKVDLKQHTAKRDKGPQVVPQPVIVREGGDLNHTHVSSATGMHSPSAPLVAVFDRIQFRVATANNGKRKATQQYFLLVVELLAECEASGDETVSQFIVAETESAPVVVRGRSPGHYLDRMRKETHRACQQVGMDAEDMGYAGKGIATLPIVPMAESMVASQSASSHSAMITSGSDGMRQTSMVLQHPSQMQGKSYQQLHPLPQFAFMNPLQCSVVGLNSSGSNGMVMNGSVQTLWPGPMSAPASYATRPGQSSYFSDANDNHDNMDTVGLPNPPSLLTPANTANRTFRSSDSNVIKTLPMIPAQKFYETWKNTSYDEMNQTSDNTTLNKSIPSPTEKTLAEAQRASAQGNMY